MKKLNIKDKRFKIIPEARLVQGVMPEKGIFHDLKMGIKNKYRMLIREAVSYGNNEKFFSGCGTGFIHANAYCDKADTFDDKIGVEVCASKLELKNHRKLARWYNRAARDLQEASLIAQHFCIRHEEKAQAIEDDLCRHYGRLKV